MAGQNVVALFVASLDADREGVAHLNGSLVEVGQGQHALGLVADVDKDLIGRNRDDGANQLLLAVFGLVRVAALEGMSKSAKDSSGSSGSATTGATGSGAWTASGAGAVLRSGSNLCGSAFRLDFHRSGYGLNSGNDFCHDFRDGFGGRCDHGFAAGSGEFSREGEISG